MLHAYMDESGTHGGAESIAVGLVFGHESVWGLWERDWNATKAPFGIDVYHAVDCHNRDGEFAGWDKSYRDEFVKAMLPVIASHNVGRVAIGIDLAAFRRAIEGEPELAVALDYAYVACFQMAVEVFLTETKKSQDHYGFKAEPIAFFHESNDYEHQAVDAFNYVKAKRTLGELPLSITFAGKKDMVPLQAADALAYEAHRAIRTHDGPRKPWLAMDPLQDRTILRTYGSHNMEFLVSTVREAIKGSAS